MRVFFYTFSGTPTAASSNDQIQKFHFSLKNVGVRWFTETILFSQELYSLVYELHYPLPPPPPQKKIAFLRCIVTKEALADEEMSL